MEANEEGRRQDHRQHPTCSADASADTSTDGRFGRSLIGVSSHVAADAIEEEGAALVEEVQDDEDATPGSTTGSTSSCRASATDHVHRGAAKRITTEPDAALLTKDKQGGESSKTGREEHATRATSTGVDEAPSPSGETDRRGGQSSQQQQEEQHEQHATAATSTSLPLASSETDAVDKSALHIRLSPSMQAANQMVDSQTEELTTKNNAKHTFGDAISEVDRGSLLGPHSREARIQHKMRRDADSDRNRSSAAAPTTSIDSTTGRITGFSAPNPNRVGDRDHHVALELVRQDIVEKAAGTGAIDNTPVALATPSSAPAITAVAASSRRLKSPPPSTSARYRSDESLSPTATSARIASSTASRPSMASIPVGAFRIQTSQSGTDFDITTPSAVNASVTSHDQSNSQEESLDDVGQEVVESSLVVESVLVDDLLLSENGGSSRRRNRHIISLQPQDDATDMEATFCSSNPNVDEEQSIQAVPESTSRSQEEVAPTSNSIPTDIAPVQDDSDYFVFQAQAPTLHGSIWTLVKSRKGRWGVLLMVIVVATLTVLGVTVFKNNTPDTGGNNKSSSNYSLESTPTFSPSPFPSTTLTSAPSTLAPTPSPTIRMFLQEDLPVGTISMIENFPLSPQGLAWRWIQEDIVTWHITDSDAKTFPKRIPRYQQMIQRFVLATIYFATNGPGWQSSIFWLDHNIHECDWYPHVAALAWPYEQGPSVCNTTTGAYTDLLLNDNFLEGSTGLPMEAALLTGLRVLDVSNNPQLAGSIPWVLCDSISRLDIKISCNANLTCDCGCHCV